MELDQAGRDARLERILDQLDDVEARIEELRPAGRAKTIVIVLFLVLVTTAVLLAAVIVPGNWDLAPFLIAASVYAWVGWVKISAKNEERTELERERTRLTGGSPAL
jgi:hypothetical protein